MNTWLIWLIALSVSGNPLIAAAVVVGFLWIGDGWWRGRLWAPWVIVQQWLRIRELDAHVALAPHDGTARAELGRLLVGRGAPARALPHLEAACEKSPELAFPAYYLGLARLGVGDFDGGRVAIERAVSIRKDLDYGAPLAALGDASAKAGRTTEAIAYFERALTSNRSSVQLHHKLGLAKLTAGDRAGAQEALAHAQALYRTAPPFKRRQERMWAWRAWWAARSAG